MAVSQWSCGSELSTVTSSTGCEEAVGAVVMRVDNLFGLALSAFLASKPPLSHVEYETHSFFNLLVGWAGLAPKFIPPLANFRSLSARQEFFSHLGNMFCKWATNTHMKLEIIANCVSLCHIGSPRRCLQSQCYRSHESSGQRIPFLKSAYLFIYRRGH